MAIVDALMSYLLRGATIKSGPYEMRPPNIAKMGLIKRGKHSKKRVAFPVRVLDIRHRNILYYSYSGPPPFAVAYCQTMNRC
jgi:hypothetical protein